MAALVALVTASMVAVSAEVAATLPFLPAPLSFFLRQIFLIPMVTTAQDPRATPENRKSLGLKREMCNIRYK